MQECCEICKNNYDHIIEVKKDGTSHWFDPFECAAYKLAPECEHCGLIIAGIGVETDNEVFCRAHCATRSLDYKDISNDTKRNRNIISY